MARRPPIDVHGTAYRGGAGLGAFLLHRVSGLVLVAWLVLFTVQQSTLLLGDDFHDRFRGVFDTAPFRVLEVAFVAAAAYHLLNGLRLVVLDLRPETARRERELVQLQTGLFFALTVPAAWVILTRFHGVG